MDPDPNLASLEAIERPPPRLVGPSTAYAVAALLERIAAEVDALPDGNALARCLRWAASGVWAAASPAGDELERVADECDTFLC